MGFTWPVQNSPPKLAELKFLGLMMKKSHSFELGTLISRLVSLVPKPRVNLTGFHGVFAPNSKHRKQITPAKRRSGGKTRSLDEDHTPAERRAALTWAHQKQAP